MAAAIPDPTHLAQVQAVLATVQQTDAKITASPAGSETLRQQEIATEHPYLNSRKTHQARKSIQGGLGKKRMVIEISSSELFEIEAQQNTTLLAMEA